MSATSVVRLVTFLEIVDNVMAVALIVGNLVINVDVLDISLEIVAWDKLTAEVEEDATNVARVVILHVNVKQKRAHAITVEKLATSKLIALKKKNHKSMKALATNVVDLAISPEIVKMRKMTEVLRMFHAIDVVTKATWPEIVKEVLKHATIAKSLVTKQKIALKDRKWIATSVTSLVIMQESVQLKSEFF